MKVGTAGGIESNDCLITVIENNELVVEIESIVDAFFHDEIEKTILSTLKELNISKIKVKCQDKGALNYTIKARLTTAIERMKDNA